MEDESKVGFGAANYGLGAQYVPNLTITEGRLLEIGRVSNGYVVKTGYSTWEVYMTKEDLLERLGQLL